MVPSISYSKKRKTTIVKMGNIIRITSVMPVSRYGKENIKHTEKSSVNSSKLENNLARAKTKVREFALCNEWDYFCTFTIDKTKYDRFDFKKYYKDLSKFIANYNRYCNDDEKVKYILIPELHKNGAWHIHGLIKGIKCKDIYINKKKHLGWYQYESKFGFISFSKIKSIDASSKYIFKYITKSSSTNNFSLGLHIYYTSKNLNIREIIATGDIHLKCEWDYITADDFCRIKEFDCRYEDYKDYVEVISETI